MRDAVSPLSFRSSVLECKLHLVILIHSERRLIGFSRLGGEFQEGGSFPCHQPCHIFVCHRPSVEHARKMERAVGISAFGHPVVECHCSCSTFRAGTLCHTRVPDLQGEQFGYDLPCILMYPFHELPGTKSSFLDFT